MSEPTLTEAQAETLYKAGDHHPEVCDCSAYIIEQAFAQGDCCEALWNTLIAASRMVAEATQQARAEALARVEEWFSDIDLDDLRASYGETP